LSKRCSSSKNNLLVSSGFLSQIHSYIIGTGLFLFGRAGISAIMHKGGVEILPSYKS